jgi:hypothetical protein
MGSGYGQEWIGRFVRWRFRCRAIKDPERNAQTIATQIPPEQWNSTNTNPTWGLWTPVSQLRDVRGLNMRLWRSSLE